MIDIDIDLDSELRDLHEAAFSWSLVCCGGDPERAQDLLQDSYLRVLDGALVFAGRSSFKTWFFAVVRRAARDRRRQSIARRALRGQWLPAPSPVVGGQERKVIAGQRAALLRRLLAGLSTRQRQVLELVFYHDLALREAGEVLGITLGSASRHYQRGKANLLAALEESSVELEL